MRAGKTAWSSALSPDSSRAVSSVSVEEANSTAIPEHDRAEVLASDLKEGSKVPRQTAKKVRPGTATN